MVDFKAPDNVLLKPVIMVFGVGGAGGNAVNNMLAANLQGANFVVANTDAQSLKHSLCENKIQLGANETKGLGAGASPEVGAAAAEESAEEIKEYLRGCNMVFITAGMGGGTGTGASPVVAKIAKELGILTVGVVTMPFDFEGPHRMGIARKGISELQKYVDTLIVIPNQNLFRIANEHTTFADAFKMADDVLHAGVRGITDLMIMPGLINLDFADVKTVISRMGKAMMGTGEASGEERSVRAAEAAISNPLLDHNSMRGARGVLINITGGADMTLFEVDTAANRIRKEVGYEEEANIIFGSTFNPELNGIIRVSVVATGIDADAIAQRPMLEKTTESEDINEEMLDDILQEEILRSKEEIEEAIEDLVAVELNEGRSAELMSEHLSKHPVNRPENVVQRSFFGKMWQSLKTGDKSSLTLSHTKEPIINYRQDSLDSSASLDSNTEEADIQEIPAFLRKKKSK